MYDFETLVDRRKTNAIKWDIKDNELPMWIADMDFKIAPEITEAMEEKVALGAFGYENVPEQYFSAVRSWYEKVHGAKAKTQWMLFVTGVIPALSSTIRRLSNIGDNVVIQAPVYNMFYNSILNNGRKILSNDLIYNEETFTYDIDFLDLEEKLAQPLTTLMLLCNPHNPVGKVWTKEELTKIAALCEKYHVILLSDEIHGDLVLEGEDYTPIFSLSEEFPNTVSFVSTSKTFNMAALHSATTIIPQEKLRLQVNRGFNTDEITEPNLLAIPGSIAAYTKGEKWLKELKEQLNKNKQLLVEFCEKNIPEVKVVKGTATYLVWLDVRELTDDAEKLANFLRKETGLFLSAGNVYGGNGNYFLRMNIASPQSLINDGLNRLAKGIKKFKD